MQRLQKSQELHAIISLVPPGPNSFSKNIIMALHQCAEACSVEGDDNFAQQAWYPHFLLTKQRRLQCSLSSTWSLHVLCTQTIEMKAAFTGPSCLHKGWINKRTQFKRLHFHTYRLLSEACFSEVIHFPSPPPCVYFWSHLQVKKFVGFSGGQEEGKTGAGNAFFFKLKINCDPELTGQKGKRRV